jgi:WD40 repeat protein
MDSTEPPINRCPQCGASLSPDTPGEPCTRCALASALATATDVDGLTELNLADIPAPGDRVAYFGDYELLNQIGKGGMGIVYRARQRSLKRIVALKMLVGGRYATDEYKARFRQEAEAVAQLHHPNIVPLFEVGEHDGQPYLTMEFVADADGGPAPTLAALVKDRPLEPEIAAKYVLTVAEAVHAAHQQGIIHRDLKPSNILVGADGRPRVADFGLAKQIGVDGSLTLSGQVLGTPGYWPPEQASDRTADVGPASDVYALGAVLYHLLTGRPPFQAATLADTLQQVLQQEPVPPKSLNQAVPRDLETICLKCLAKEPLRRYSSALALAQDLNRWLAGEPVLARPVSPPQQAWLWARRNPAIALLAAVLALSLAAGTGAILWQLRLTSAANVALTETNLRLEIESAERRTGNNMENGGISTIRQIAEPIARLAACVRRNPAHPVATHRLVSALQDKDLALPLPPPFSTRDTPFPAQLSPSGRLVFGKAPDGGMVVFSLTQPAMLPVTLRTPTNAIYLTIGTDDHSYLVLLDNGIICRIDGSTGAEAGRIQTDLANAGVTLAHVQMKCATNILLLASSNGTINAIPLSPSSRPCEWKAHTTALKKMAFTANETVLITCADREIRAWNVTSNFSLINTVSLTRSHEHLAINPHTKQVATHDPQLGPGIMDFSTPKPEFRLIEHSTNNVSALDFSPDGTRLAIGGTDGSVTIVDPDTRSILSRFRAHTSSVFALGFRRDGLVLATGTSTGELRTWNLATACPLSENVPGNGVVFSLSFTHDGRKLLAQTVEGPRTSNGEVRLLDALPGRARPFPLGRLPEVFGYGFSAGTQDVFTLNKNGSVDLWDRLTLERKRRIIQPFAEVARAFCGDDVSRILIEDKEDKLWIIDVDLGSARLVTGLLETSPAHAVFSNDNRLLAVACSTNIIIVDTMTCRPTGTILSVNDVTHSDLNRSFGPLSFNHDCSRLVACCGLFVYVWDVNTGRLCTFADLPPGSLACDFETTGSRIAVGAFDGKARVVEISGSGGIRLTLTHIALQRTTAMQGILKLSFSPDDSVIATLGVDFSLSMFSNSTGARLPNPFEAERAARWYDMSPNSQQLFIRDMDAKYRMWDITTGLPLSEALGDHMSGLEDTVTYNNVSSNSWDPYDVLRPFGVYRDRYRVKTRPGDALPPPRLAWGVHDRGWTHFLARGSDQHLAIWNCAVLPLPCPSWLPDLAESLVQQRVDTEGRSYPVEVEEFHRIKRFLLSRPPSDPWALWAHWFLGDRSQRRLSWSDSRTMPQLIAQLMATGNKNHVHAAALLAPSNPEVFVALARATLDETANQQRFVQADYLCRYAVGLAPDDPAVGEAVAQVQRRCRGEYTQSKP